MKIRIVVVAALLLSACGGPSGDNVPGTPNTPTEQEQLKVLSYQTAPFIGSSITTLTSPFQDGVRTSPTQLDAPDLVGLDYSGEDLVMLASEVRAGEEDGGYEHTLYRYEGGTLSAEGAFTLAFKGTDLSVGPGGLLAILSNRGMDVAFVSQDLGVLGEEALEGLTASAIDFQGDDLLLVGENKLARKSPARLGSLTMLTELRGEPASLASPLEALEVVGEVAYSMDSNTSGAQLFRIPLSTSQEGYGTAERIAGYVDLERVRDIAMKP